MKSDIISTLLDYYSTEPLFEEVFHQATHDFFGVPNCQKLGQLRREYDEDREALFVEWFIFDYKLPTKMTLLDDFVGRNPLELSHATLFQYDSLRLNQFGLFRVIASQPGRVEVESVKTGERFVVREYSAAPNLAPRNTVIVRIASVEGRWEFIGAKVRVLPVELSDQMVSWLRRAKGRLTPLEIYQIWYAPNRPHGPALDPFTADDPTMTLKRALQEATAAFKAAGILPFVSVRQMQRWVQIALQSADPNIPSALVLGLADPDQPPEVISRLLSALSNLMNHTPRRALRGRTPVEAAARRRARGKSPRLVQTVFDQSVHRQIYHRGLKAMQKGQLATTLKAFDRTFELLLEHQTTERDIFRLFANKGAAMLAAGNPNGEVLLRIAHDLNPHYDFVQSQLKRLKAGDFETNMLRFTYAHPEFHAGLKALGKPRTAVTVSKIKRLIGRVNRALDRELKHDPAIRYAAWLEPFKINFSAQPIEPAQITEHRIV